MQQSSQNHPSKSILILGETGSGKSTFVNIITNYFKEGSLDNLKIAIPTVFFQSTEGYAHTENNTQNNAMSQTTHCTTYSFELDGMTYNFIDTPGLTDIGYARQNNLNVQNILETAEATADLAGVLLIVECPRAKRP